MPSSGGEEKQGRRKEETSDNREDKENEENVGKVKLMLKKKMGSKIKDKRTKKAKEKGK